MTYITNNSENIDFTTIMEDPKNATVFHHFKGNDYQILTFAFDSETMHQKVVYQKMDDSKTCFIRDAEMFFSDVDKNKYPNEKQKKRFEII